MDRTTSQTKQCTKNKTSVKDVKGNLCPNFSKLKTSILKCSKDHLTNRTEELKAPHRIAYLPKIGVYSPIKSHHISHAKPIVAAYGLVNTIFRLCATHSPKT